MLRLVLWLLCSVVAGAAQADLVPCHTSIDGELIGLHYDDDIAAVRANRSLRERSLAGWGEIDCPAFVTLRRLTPDLTDEERGPFCLLYDSDVDTYTGFSEGPRDAYLRCKQSAGFCARVNRSRATAEAISGFGTELLTGKTTAAASAGLTAIQQSAGATILSGTSSAISTAFATAGASALAVLSAPATLAAASVTVVAVGGATYLCTPGTSADTP